VRIQDILNKGSTWLDRADDVVETFSGGNEAALSLACALVHNPRLAVLDEPTVGR